MKGMVNEMPKLEENKVIAILLVNVKYGDQIKKAGEEIELKSIIEYNTLAKQGICKKD